MSKLRRVLGPVDLVLLNVVAVVGLRWWLSSAGGYSWAALPLWGLACLFFFIPSALAVVELTTRFPEEGGIYVWTKRAFGEGHGFISGWCLWTNNLFYFPTLLLFIAGNLVFMLGPEFMHLEENRLLMATVSLLLFWFCLAVNVRGLKYGRWVNNIGALGTWIPAMLLIVLGAYALFRFGTRTPFQAADLVPVFSLGTVAFFAQMCFGFSGIELASVMGEEIINPRRNVPRAIMIAGAIITLIYVLGTAALLVALPREEIGLLSGVSYAIAAVQERMGLGFLAGASALLIGLGALGATSAWVAGAARYPFVVGIDRYLPAAFGRLHPRYASPHVALLVTAGVSSVLILVSFIGGGVQEAYLLLADFTIVVYFIPYLYLFAALFRLSSRRAPDLAGVVPVPGGRPGVFLVSVVGFVTTAVAIFCALVPPAITPNPGLFLARLVGGCIVVLLSGWLFYYFGGRRAARLGPHP